LQPLPLPTTAALSRRSRNEREGNNSHLGVSPGGSKSSARLQQDAGFPLEESKSKVVVSVQSSGGRARRESTEE